MANEWTAVELYGSNNDGAPRRYTIADATAVSKGQLLALSDPRTVTAANATTLVYAGVASEEHKPNIGVTSVSAWTDGVFEAVCSGAISIGAGITGAENNQIQVSGALVGANLASGAICLGYSFEDGANAETINVRLRL